MFSVSQSKLKTWRECRMKYYFAHILNLMKKIKARPLTRGSIIHDMLEANINGDDPWKAYNKAIKKLGKLFKEEADEFGDMPTEVKLLMEGYFEYYKDDPLHYVLHQGKRAEFDIDLPLSPGINFKGKIDSFATAKRLKWLVEHKSHKQIPVSEFKFTDLQSVVYTWAAPQIGLPKPDGVCWDYIKAGTPAVPEILASGKGLSQRKNMNTTWAIYKQAIKDNNFKISDYKDMKEILRGKEADFYMRVYLPTSDTLCNNVMDECRTTAKEIQKLAGKDTTRNMNKHCEWCGFQAPCRAMLLGLDWQYMLDTDFMENDYYANKETKSKRKTTRKKIKVKRS